MSLYLISYRTAVVTPKKSECEARRSDAHQVQEQVTSRNRNRTIAVLAPLRFTTAYEPRLS
eukprot:410799-Prymnesium_polylepis.1